MVVMDCHNAIVFDWYNLHSQNRKLELVGYMLPSRLNDSSDTADGIKVATRLGIRNEKISIEGVVQAYATTNPELFETGSGYHKGNLMAEIRATILHAKAGIEKKLVLGTGNCDEDFGVAYYTLFGDGAVHLSPIGNLSKRLVRQMAAYLGFEDLANRVPAAGLEPGQTDFKDLGYDYDLVELVREGLNQGFSLEELIQHQQIVPESQRQMKIYKEKFGMIKFDDVSKMVNDIYRRNRIAKVKANIVHPPIAPITLIY
jgi:NAD+ synthetase